MSGYHPTILQLPESGGFDFGYRQRRCEVSLLTDHGVATCWRTPKHEGNHATLDETFTKIVQFWEA